MPFLALLLIFTVLLASPSFANEISFDGIALGDEAKRLIKKFRIDPADASGYSSDEGCARIAAKRLISCVCHVAQCRQEGQNVDWCPPADKCASETERSRRASEDEQCREEEAEATRLDKWAKTLKFAIRPDQIVCATPDLYRKVINAYLDGDQRPLRSQIGYGCRVIETLTLAKIIGKSKEGKLVHVQYAVPYSNQLTDGWLRKSGLISKGEYLKSRY